MYMIDKNKIKLMTIMAVYDKNHGDKDRQIEGFYKGSYVYRKNCVTRIGVIFGIFILFCFYVLDNLIVREFDFAGFDYLSAIVRWGLFTISLLVIYTIIGTIKFGKEYEEAAKRLKGYEYVAKMLDSYYENK